MCCSISQTNEVCWRLSVIVCKLMCISLFVGAWLVLAYMQSRVWNELPVQLERTSERVLAAHGCATCQPTPDGVWFMCTACTVREKRSDASQYTQAVLRTAHEIEREFEWLTRLDFVSHYLARFVRMVATEPARVATWMLLLQMCSTAMFGLWWLFGTCRNGCRQFKMQDGTLRPRGTVSSLPGSFQEMMPQTDTREGVEHDADLYRRFKVHHL